MGLALAGGSYAFARSTPQPTRSPAVRIQPAQPQLGGPASVGAGPLVINYSHWHSDNTFEFDPVTGTASALVRLRQNYELEAINHDDFTFGFLYPKASSQVGDPIDPDALQPDIQPSGFDANLAAAYWGERECYVPLFLQRIDPNLQQYERHVCAFVRVRIEPDPDHGSPTGDPILRVTILRNELVPDEPWLALRNASAQFDGTQPPIVFPNTPYDWTNLRRALSHLPAGGSPEGDLYRESRVYVP